MLNQLNLQEMRTGSKPIPTTPLRCVTQCFQDVYMCMCGWVGAVIGKALVFRIFALPFSFLIYIAAPSFQYIAAPSFQYIAAPSFQYVVASSF